MTQQVAALLNEVAAGQHHFVLDSSWAQGRTAFGGLVVALLVEAMQSRAEGRPLRSLSVSFIGPVPMGERLDVQVECLRVGSSVSHIVASLLHQEQVVTTVQGSFGRARSSALQVDAEPVHLQLEPERLQDLPYIAGVMPAFTQHLALRWGLGGLPFSGSQSHAIGGWMRLRHGAAESALRCSQLFVLLDAWPPVVLSQLSVPASASSLTWQVELLQPLSGVLQTDWLGYQAQLEQARDGYSYSTAKVFGRDGQVFALSRQCVTVFA
jgi:acyl-CoA thioesterase